MKNLLHYDTDEEYQHSLLDLFGFTEYTDNLSQCILDLYPSVQHLSLLGTILNILEKSCPLCTSETSFLLLFSYDLLPYTHAFLVEYHETGTLSSLDILYNKVLPYTI
jgi:hypothetical protein